MPEQHAKGARQSWEHASAQFWVADGALPASSLLVEAYPAALHLVHYGFTSALPHNVIDLCCSATGEKCHWMSMYATRTSFEVQHYVPSIHLPAVQHQFD